MGVAILLSALIVVMFGGLGWGLGQMMDYNRPDIRYTTLGTLLGVIVGGCAGAFAIGKAARILHLTCFAQLSASCSMSATLSALSLRPPQKPPPPWQAIWD